MTTDSIEIEFFDSRGRQLKPLVEQEVGLYVCGPTVYQRAHIGNARPYIVFAWLTAFLRSSGRKVTFVHNLTDVNDKIYQARPGASSELARQACEWYIEDIRDLGLPMPDYMPRVTEYVPRIVSYIDDLIRHGAAYEVAGDVYFRISSVDTYGMLAGRQDFISEEVEPSGNKEDPRDFALWKKTKPGEDTSWDSPWSKGRPGWHIECTVMAEDRLGDHFSIHGAGLDIVFPHNENEWAQSAALGHEYADLWMHNGMVRFAGDKMSKSLGNIITIREALDTWGRDAVLIFFMAAHWRSSVDFSSAAMASARTRLERLRNSVAKDRGGNPGSDLDAADWGDFVAALAHDFNTPECLALMHGWAQAGKANLVRRGLEFFGIDSTGEDVAEAPAEIVQLANERRAARLAGDFGGADALRDKLSSLGWSIRDTAGDPGFELTLNN